jgi:threonine dehydrogenase-like Zn-dependent dehydrogenase
MLGAKRVIAIDRFDYRLRMAESGGAETINYEEVDDVVQTLKDMTANVGPDRCIDAVGMEAHSDTFIYMVDKVKQAMRIETDRPIALRQAIIACRKGGTVSVPGVYGGFDDKIPMGAFMNKALAMKTGQTHMMRFMKPLLDSIQRGQIDPSFVISHRVPINRAPEMYKKFRDKEDNCTKVVLDPWADGAAAA